MKLNKIRIRNYRSIRDITLDIHNDISLIVGKNNIGKSNVLKGIDLFFQNFTSPHSTNVNVDDEDFRFNTTKITIMLLFGNIKEYICSIKSKLKKEFDRGKRSNKKMLAEYEETIQVLELYNNKFNEISIELIVYRNDKRKEFKVLNDLHKKRKNKYMNERIIRNIIDLNPKKFSEYAIDQKWLFPELFKLTEVEDTYKIVDNKSEFSFQINKSQIQIDKIVDYKYAQKKLLDIFSDTQKFLYVQAYRGGKKERANTVERLFDIIIDDLVETKGVTKDYDIISNSIWGTGKNPAKDYLNLVIEERVRDLKQSLNDESVSNINKVIFKPHNKKDIRRNVLKLLLGTSNIILDDGIETSFESKGTGLQSSFMISLMKSLSGFQFKSCQNIILVIEEPEAFTHPQLTREIIHKITDSNFAQKYQFILTTHSPVIVNYIDSRKIQRLIEKHSNSNKSTESANKINGGMTSEDWNLINRIIDINISEIVFSDFVLFVEGEGDQAVFQQFMKILIPEYLHRISIISISGFNQIFKLQKLLKYYNINWLLISDKDAFIEKGFSEDNITLSNFNDMMKSLQIGDEYKEKWQTVLNNTMVDKIVLKQSAANSSNHGELLKKIGKDILNNDNKNDLFQIVCGKIDEQFVSDLESIEVINRFNSKLKEFTQSYYCLESDLEGLVINQETYKTTLNIYKKYYEDSYNEFIIRVKEYSLENQVNELRKTFGSKCYQLLRPSNRAKQRKKPHIPIEIISDYLQEKKPDSNKLISDFPILDKLKDLIIDVFEK